jgi:hypothetical protein
MQPVPWGKTRSHVGDQPGNHLPSPLIMGLEVSQLSPWDRLGTGPISDL